MTNTIVYLVTTLATYVLGLVSKKFNLNEVVPVQIQNIVIAIISFVVLFFINTLSGNEFNGKEVLESVIVAVGGVGTATLAYDTTKINKE